MNTVWRKKKTIQKRIWMTAMALAGMFLASGCGHGRDQGGGGGVVVDPYARAWYDVYGTYCYTGRPMPGCNFYSDGLKIIDREDPYYSSGNYLQYGTWSYTDSYGYSRYYTGYGWLSPTGILYDDYGYALNEDSDRGSRDLMSDVGAKEAKMVELAAQGLQERFALSSDTSAMIAQTLQDWAVLGKKHGRSEADVAEFTRRLFGQSVDKIKPALEEAAQGKVDKLESLNKEVASYWGTQPETSKEILTGWYKAQISAAQGN